MNVRLLFLRHVLLFGLCCGSVLVQAQAILVQTPYLNDPLGRGRQVTLYGVLDGTGTLTFDPNRCGLNDFGDTEMCTMMAPANRQVDLIHLRRPDPRGMGRKLYSVRNSGLSGQLYLVVPSDPLCGPFRFVHVTSAGTRVIGAERLTWKAKGGEVRTAAEGEEPVRFSDLPCACHHELVDFNEARVVPGVANGTYILIVSGETPHINMNVRLVPYIYIGQPEYWGIEVIATSDEPPAGPPGRFYAHIPLDGIVGTKGVEVIGETKSIQLAVPPSANDNDKEESEEEKP